MEVIFMGTGTSQGVPMIGQKEGTFNAADPKNFRTRSSIHVRAAGHHIQVDAGQEFRIQCLREDIRQLDFFLLTHGHADHILGMDDLRRFCDARGGTAIPVYSTPEGLGRVQAIYPYAVREKPLSSGYPAFELRQMPSVLELEGLRIRSVRQPHGPVESLGFVFEELGKDGAPVARFAYYCDCSAMTDEAVALAKGCDAVALDGLRPRWHPTHMSVQDACAAAERIGAHRTFLTHLTYEIDHARMQRELPAGVFYAWDGLRLNLPDDREPQGCGF